MRSSVIHISDAELERFITEDVPFIDLTTSALGIGEEQGHIEYFTREDCMLCGTEEVVRIAALLGLEVIKAQPSGTRLAVGDTFFAAQGDAAALHRAWKVCLNLFDHCSAIATKTDAMVSAAHAVAPDVAVLTTRKIMPGTKLLATKAVITGGAEPHRLGLSETVLVFDHHIAFMGGIDAFITRLPHIRARLCEKKVIVEADAATAFRLVEAGVDGIQFDKLSPVELERLVPELRARDARVTLIAAGGINPSNAAAYAATGVDGLATTSLYTAKPLDMSVRMQPLRGPFSV
jgi:molybdenum transport protein